MDDKLIEVMAKAVVYTCMVLAGTAVIFLFAGAAAGGHSWAYVEAAVKKCIATGVTTVEEYEAHHQRETGRRVDRATPSGNDILAAARSRPLRLKREE